MTSHNPLGKTPEEFSAGARQWEIDKYPIQKWQVRIGASHVGSQGALYYVKREYTIEARECDLNEAAIARAYQDGDIEHVRVEFTKRIQP